MKKEATPKHMGLDNKDLQWKKRQTQNIWGSITETSDKKRGNPKMQVALKQRPPTKKEATPKCMGLKNQELQWKRVKSSKPALPI
jgi:hypothetical protein